MSDQYWDQVILLMHMDGINGSVRFRDERNHVISAVAGNAQLSTAQKKFGASSLLLDGTGDYVSIQGSDFSFGFGDFTVEGWIRTTAAKDQVFFDNYGGSGWQILITAAGKLNLYNVATGTTNLADGNWHHIAVCRAGTTLRLFADGLLEASATNTANYGQAGSFVAIGAQAISRNTSFDFNGNIDEVRVTKGVARYTAAFTPPAAAFPDYGPSGPRTDPHYSNVVLHCHCDGENNATAFTDQKGHAIARAGASVTSTYYSSGLYKFGASGAVLPNPSAIGCTHPDMDVGADDFTIDGWAAMGNTAAFPLITMIDAAGTGAGLRVTAGGSNSVVIVNGSVVASGLSFFDSMNGTESVSHFAVCREGSKLSGYAGGVRKWQVDIGAVAISSNGSIWFGIEPLLGATGATARTIYLDEIRVTKGLARYSKDAASFAVPTEPFPDFAVQKLTGTVRDPAGNPLSRVVRSYRRSDGLLIDSATSDAVTGAFSLRATDTTPHFVVVHDDVKNALVFDHVVPVI